MLVRTHPEFRTWDEDHIGERIRLRRLDAFGNLAFRTHVALSFGPMEKWHGLRPFSKSQSSQEAAAAMTEGPGGHPATSRSYRRAPARMPAHVAVATDDLGGVEHRRQSAV
jgi:hypothetical protein